MQTLNDIHHWQRLGDGEVFLFDNDRPRTVKMRVNTSEKTVLMVQLLANGTFEGETEPRFLALVEGLETVTFVTPGPFELMHKTPGAEVFFLTADGAAVHRQNLDKEAYTRLHERRAVNPELEYMRYQMEANFQRRMAMQEAQIQRMIDEARAAGTATADSSQSESDAGQQAPAPQPVEDAGEGGGSQ